MADEITLAQKYFDAYVASMSLEDDLNDALLEAVGINPGIEGHPWPFEDITYDHYDGSFEFKKTRLDWKITPEQLKLCWKLGFSRCWICYVNGDEQYYTWDGYTGHKQNE